MYFNWVDFVALWLGRGIIYASLAVFIYLSLYWAYIDFFRKRPYCPKCGSRKLATVCGNSSGGYRCADCSTHYWWVGGLWRRGKSTLQKPK